MPTRRTVLAAVVLAVATGGGAAAGWQRPRPRAKQPAPDNPPAWLTTAIARERALIAGLTAGPSPASARLQPLIADHTAHLTALLALPGAPPAAAMPDPVETPEPASSGAAASSSAPIGPTISALAAAEAAAADAAATQSGARQGNAAVLLASIAACEDSHAQWLS